MSYYELDETDPAIKQPKGLKVKLRPHQLTIISAMRELENQASIVIDKPSITSGLYSTVKFKLQDVNDFTDSTFVIETNSAILADKVGSGKTYMIIGLILNTPEPKSHDRFIIGTDHFSIKMISIKESVPTNLIVVPHNLANQWSDFVDKSNLEYLKLNSVSDFDIFFDIDYVTKQVVLPNHQLVLYRRSKKKIISPKKIKTKDGSKSKANNPNQIYYERLILSPKKVKKFLDSTAVIILNVNRYRLFKQIFRSVKWARVIIDEMDSASVPSMFDEFGCFNWFLTATPTSIFYKSCRRYVNKIFGYNQHLLQYFIVKNKDDYVDKSIILPKPNVFIIKTMLQRVVSAIHDLIPADVLNLINAGNMKEAVAKLNCDMDTEENIVKVLTDKIHTELHNLNKELDYVKTLIPVDVDAHEKRIKRLETDIARCNTKLGTINERIKSIKDDCCFICADAFDNPTILDCCKSVFCLKCLLSALKSGQNKCPYCRHVVKNGREYHVISSKPTKKDTVVEKSKVNIKKFSDMDKSDVLQQILTYIAKNDNMPKILIFSDYSQTFDKIIKNIAQAGLEYSLLSGIPAHITNVINNFKAGKINILMLDSQHYGSGLNLQDADYIILYHRMTAELETQVIGRAQRFGRKKPLQIIYLVNSSENCTTKVVANPLKLEAEDELWMLTDPPTDNAVEEIVETDEKIEENNSADDIPDDIPDDISQDTDDNIIDDKAKTKSKPKSKLNSKSKSKKSKTKVTNSKSKAGSKTNKKKLVKSKPKRKIIDV